MADLVELRKFREDALAAGDEAMVVRADAAIAKARQEATHTGTVGPDERNRLGAPGRVEALHEMAIEARAAGDASLLEKVRAEILRENQHAQKIVLQTELAKDGPVAQALGTFGQEAKQAIKNAADFVGLGGGPKGNAIQRILAAGVSDKPGWFQGSTGTPEEELKITAPLRAGSPTASTMGSAAINIPVAVALSKGAGASPLAQIATGGVQGAAFSDPGSRDINGALGVIASGLGSAFANRFSKEGLEATGANAAGRRDVLTAKVLQLTPADVEMLVQKYGSVGNFGSRLRALGGGVVKPGKTMAGRAGELEALAKRYGVELGEVVQDATSQGATVDHSTLVNRLRGAVEKRFDPAVLEGSPGEYAEARAGMEARVGRIERAVTPRYRATGTKIERVEPQMEFGFPPEQTTIYPGARLTPSEPKSPVAITREARGAMGTEDGQRILFPILDEPMPPRGVQTTTRLRPEGPEGSLVPREVKITGETYPYTPGKAEAPTPPSERLLADTTRPNPNSQWGIAREHVPATVQATEDVGRQPTLFTGHPVPDAPRYVPIATEVAVQPVPLSTVSRWKTNTGNAARNAAAKRPPSADAMKYDPSAAAEEDILAALIDAEEKGVAATVPEKVAEFLRLKEMTGAAKDASKIARRSQAALEAQPLAEGGGTPRSTIFRNIYNKTLQPLITPRAAQFNAWVADKAPKIARWTPSATEYDPMTAYLIEALRQKESQ